MESEAPPSAGFYNLLGWLDVNKKRVALAVVLVAVVGCVAALLVWQKGQREIKAGEALSSVPTPLNPTEPSPAGTAEKFLKVAEDYSGTAAGAQARLRAASTFFAERDWAKAQEQFEKFVRSHGDTPWVPQAVFGIAACLDAQNKASEGIAKYNDYLKSYPNDAGADQARMNLARLYEKANQPQQAIDILDKIAKSAQFTPAASEAQEHLRELYARHPGLIPTNTPPPVSPMQLPRTEIISATTNAAATNVPKIILQTPGQSQ